MSTATEVSPNLVGSEWTTEGDGAIEVRDPSDLDAVVGAVPAMTQQQITSVYDAAEQGAATWRASGWIERGTVLARAAGLLRERSEPIATDLVREMGKTLAEATIEVAKAADFFDYYASQARFPVGQALADARPGVTVGVRVEPVGIVLAITPWNDPLLTPARKLAPALFAGNAVILKPATETPLVSLHLARALHDAGLPAGVLGTITGRSSSIADALISDPRLKAITFTGSNEVGEGIRRAIADTHIRLQTELGGKNATAVLADADIELAATTIAAASFGQAGQRCTATSRVVADRAVAGELVDAIAQRAKALRLGPGLDPETNMGPVVSERQQEDVLGFLERAKGEGATVVTGGGKPADEALANGCYVEPTIFSDVEPAMEIWREEVFGPAIAVIETDGVQGAIDAVNDSRFGLSAAVFTTSLDSATLFADQVNTGQVSVNLPTSGWDIHHPFGGFGVSGSPFKEQGLEGLRFYQRVKTVATRAGV